jgi:D-alanine-D-alanine ligase
MGGPSSEHDVSLQGGQKVVEALLPRRYEVLPVLITREGRWRSPARAWKASGPAFDPYRTDGWKEDAGVLEGLLRLRRWGADVVLPILHGRFGEDGTLQACLAAAGLAFAGSGSAASALASDKVRTKEVLAYHGVATPRFEVLEAEDLRRGRAETAERLVATFGTPLVLKDPWGGSSLEVRIVDDAKAAAAAIGELVPPARRLLVEAYVAGRELTGGVLADREGGGAIALPIVEIRPRKGKSFDYFEKYSAEGAEELCPAPIAPEVEEAARGLALRVHRLLGLSDLSRTDLILDRSGVLQVLEVNTIPGLTERSLVPRAARAVGISFADLVETLVRTAAVR